MVANISSVWIICTKKQPFLFPQIYLYVKAFNRLISIDKNLEGISSRGFLTNQLRLARYELQVTIYCASYELLFIA